MNVLTTEEEKFIKSTTLYMKGISKTFGSNRALDNVEMAIMPGEIMGLLGKNGCGKSTLIKILSGYHKPDPDGELYLCGEKVELPMQPGEFKKYGVSFVHQDLGLVDSLTVAENWNLEAIATTNQAKINWKAVRKEAAAICARYSVEMDPDALVSTLGPVQKAMLAILRAVSQLQDAKAKGRGLLVLDEPTVFLPKTEVDTLFHLVRSITQEGISVMFVSHDIDEVIALTDSFTVLRDGKNVGSGSSHVVDKNGIIEMILGQRLEEYHTQPKSPEIAHKEKPVLQVYGVNGDLVRPSDFAVYPGEVLGITGLVGSGFEEIPYLLFGGAKRAYGEMDFLGKHYDLSHLTPSEMVAAGMALIPADRKNLGGVLNLEISDNIMMQSMQHYCPYKLQRRKLRHHAMELVSEYQVHPKSIDLQFGQLSGGNQQKVLLAKWIQEDPKMLILHEPTQGIDIGARQAIYQLIADTIQRTGMSVICSSSDYEQLEQICDRVLILVDGRIVNELTGSEINKARISQLCYQTAVRVG